MPHWVAATGQVACLTPLEPQAPAAVFGANRWDAAEFASETDKEKFTRLMVRPRAQRPWARLPLCVAAARPAACLHRCGVCQAGSHTGHRGVSQHRQSPGAGALQRHPAGLPCGLALRWALRSRLQRAANALMSDTEPGGMRPHSGAAVRGV
jgi:hypothetical protein